MEGNFLTAGDLALIRTEGRNYNGYGDGYCHRNRQGMAATGIGLAAGLGGAGFVAALVIGWGLNQASKARARAAENTIAQVSKTQEMLIGVINREVTRQDGVNIDVQQTLRNQAYTSAYGGGASANSNALATAEALALLQNNNNATGLNSAVGGCNYLRVARVSGSRLCGCNNCGGDAE